MFCTTAYPTIIHRPVLAVLILLLSGAVVGCSGDDEVPKYGIEGMVSLDEQPAVKASLRFTPDTASGTVGPQAFAFAKNGSFRLYAEQGLVAGVFNVYVELVDESDNVIGAASKTVTVEPNADNSFSITLTSADLAAEKARKGQDGDEGSEDEDDED